jgi:hypothetical protein
MKLLRPRQATSTPRWQHRREAARLLVASFDGGPAIDHLQAHPASRALGGPDAALRYLHEEWVTLFGVALEDELERVPAVSDAAWLAWDRVAVEEPRLVEILWSSRTNRSLQEADHRHRLRLAGLAGCSVLVVPGFADRSVPRDR